MKRYNLVQEYTSMSGRCPDVYMVEDTQGEYVKFHEAFPHIYYLDKVDEYGNQPGWHFSDESEGLNGPYKSCKEADNAFIDYCAWR